MEYLDPVVDPENPNVDIVFVHGLNPKGSTNHARQTWTDTTSEVFWPSDLLRQDIPSARVLLFSYNSSILSNASSAHVGSHAITLCDRLKNRRLRDEEKHRPLIFVAHSLGGLLVKQALVEAMFIVEETSAKLGCQGENPQGVDRNHSDICKFSGLDDRAYEGVGPNLKSRDDLIADIEYKWSKALPRRVSLSGLGGVGRTELSISLAEKVGQFGNVLFLRATDNELFQEDLVTAARDLRSELLRFDYHIDENTGEDRRSTAVYFSPPTMTDLVSILKRWLRSRPDDGSRVLIILDDLDGLEQTDHEEYSKVFSEDALDLIYTTRDPTMADMGMLWQAVKFHVPSLQENQALVMLEYFSRYGFAVQPKSISNPGEDTSGSEHDSRKEMQTREIVTSLGALPAAIVIGAHYIKDNFGSRWNRDSYQQFLDAWGQDGGNSNILQSRRAMLKYRHSMLASYEISLCRLRRNVSHIVWGEKLEMCCVVLLQLLAVMNIREISGQDLAEFKRALGMAWQNLQGDVRKAEFSYTLVGLRTPDHEISIDNCISELLKVSLLTERSKDKALLLNNVTRVCALFVPNSISSAVKFVVEQSAKEVWKHWNKDDIQQSDGHG